VVSNFAVCTVYTVVGRGGEREANLGGARIISLKSKASTSLAGRGYCKGGPIWVIIIPRRYTLSHLFRAHPSSPLRPPPSLHAAQHPISPGLFPLNAK
jgi:hypothetical protein